MNDAPHLIDSPWICSFQRLTLTRSLSRAATLASRTSSPVLLPHTDNVCVPCSSTNCHPPAFSLSFDVCYPLTYISILICDPTSDSQTNTFPRSLPRFVHALGSISKSLARTLLLSSSSNVICEMLVSCNALSRHLPSSSVLCFESIGLPRLWLTHRCCCNDSARGKCAGSSFCLGLAWSLVSVHISPILVAD
jgi:hypothetical protein